MYSSNSSQQVLEAIAELNDNQIEIVLQFIQTLKPKGHNKSTSINLDPLAKFVGAIHNGNLAQQIDQDLYG